MAQTGQYWTVLKKGVWFDNPVFIQILGICSTLAVTNQLTNTLIMALGVTFATAFGDFTISALRNFTPRKVRMIVQVLVFSFYVIIVDIILRAFLPEISKQLGPYVGLIITNCILMGRAEAFAISNKPLISFWDGLTAGLGYTFVLLSIAFVRELLGFGSLFGIPVAPAGFEKWIIMVMPPSAFFMIGTLLWIAKSIMNKPKPQGGKP